jgi:anti-anti-sigma regulatory factor
MTIPPAILVGTDGKKVLVRVEGKGTFLNSTALKEFAKEMTNRGYREFRVDLANCSLMDSTFMGTLTGISLRLRELGVGELRLAHVNERCLGLLTGLGLDQLLTIEKPEAAPVEPTPTAPLPAEPADKARLAQTMLDAHQDIVKANPATAPQMKNVIDYIKQDLQGGQ